MTPLKVSRKQGVFLSIGVFLLISMVLCYEYVSSFMAGLQDFSFVLPALSIEFPGCEFVETESEHVELIRLHPESLFELESLELGDWSDEFHATELRGVIRPTRIISCDLDFVQHSYFEVLLQGHALAAAEAIWKPKSPAGDRWTFLLLLPSPGEYEVKVNLVFGNYSGMLQDYESMESFMGAVKVNREAYPTRIMRPIVQGIQKVVVPEDKPAHHPASLRLCDLSDFEASIPGYWYNKTAWYPYTCQIPDLDPTQVLSGLWVHFYGDSNPRRVFIETCQKVNAELVMDSSKVKAYRCIGPDFVLTYSQYWIGHSPIGPVNSLDLRATIQATMNTSDPKAFSDVLETVPKNILDLKTPDFVVLHPGSHTTNNIGPAFAQELLEMLNMNASTWLDEGRLILTMAPATCIQKIPSFKVGQDLLQNNLRFKFGNDNVVEVFRGKASFVDYYSVALPLAITHQTDDAVHYPSPVNQVFAQLVLRALQERRRTIESQQ